MKRLVPLPGGEAALSMSRGTCRCGVSVLVWLAFTGSLTLGVASASTITLDVPSTHRTSLQLGQNYSISVRTSSAPQNEYSSLSLQIHSQLYNISLTNASQYCQSTHDMECTARGSNVGLVQVLNEVVSEFLFHVQVECVHGQCSSGNTSVEVLIAVFGIPIADPIPGGCALTSNLVIDPNLAVSYTPYSTLVRFQDSDWGFNPSDQPYPVCDVPTVNSTYPLQKMKYTLYQKCLGSRQFSVSAMMDAITDMLSVELSEKQEYSFIDLKYVDPKMVKYASISGQGVVYNVIVTDETTGAKSAYVPTISYACDLHSSNDQSCRGDVPAINVVIGVVLVVLGLTLCFVGHNFFHAEVVVFHAVGGSFLWFMIFSIITSWDHDLLVGLAMLFGLLYSLVWFLFWFLTGWYWFQVIAFGLYTDFILTASMLYSPLEDISALKVLQISYVYILTVICGMILFMIPVVAFPRALSIWTSTLVGSYTFVFGVGMFTYTELSEIVLLVVRKFSIPGFYSARLDCPLQTTDYVLAAVWLLLLVTGLVIQTTIVELRKRKFKQRQLIQRSSQRTKYNSFPHPSLLKKIHRCRKRKCPEDKPLLTPNGRNSPSHSHWSPVRHSQLPSNSRWSPSNYGTSPGNYGAIGSVNEPTYRRY